MHEMLVSPSVLVKKFIHEASNDYVKVQKFVISRNIAVKGTCKKALRKSTF